MTLSRKHSLYYSSWAEIDLKAIVGNFRRLQSVAEEATRMLCVVKADAYGHGMVEVSRALEKAGADFFGVADINEGITLRKHGIKKPILIFANTLVRHVKEIVAYELTPTVCTRELAGALNRHARGAGKKINVHIKVDTGMGRLGIWHKEAVEFIISLSRLNFLRLEGLYTHFPSADIDEPFTKNQIEDFAKLMSRLKDLKIFIPMAHAANSMGLAGYGGGYFNLARPGLMLYGMYPHGGVRKRISLKPALSVQSHVMFIKDIPRGRSISYGRTFIAMRKMKVATVPIGYSDGYFRCLSNKSLVLINGMFCPVVGRVTMDQIVVDVTGAGSVRIGSEVVLLGKQKTRNISADDIARWAKTINYEITCNLGNRLPRFYNNKSKP